jgi:phage replication initiation protein
MDVFARGLAANLGILEFEEQQRQGVKTLVIDGDSVTVALPPNCNTGVTDTLVKDWREKGVNYRSGVDTIEVTFPLKDVQTLDKLLPYLVETFGGGQVMPNGLLGYPNQVLCTDGVRLLYNPNQLRQGLHLIMSGEANQRHCLRLGDSEATTATFVMLQEYKPKCTRVDLYIDSAVDTMGQVWASLRSRELVTRSRSKGRSVAQVDLSTGEIEGETLYIGSVKSDRMTRFYDKATEQQVAGVWTRCESQFRRSAAHSAFNAWLSGNFDVESIIAAYVDFRQVTGDSNKTRRPRVTWWERWLGNVKRFSGASVEKVADSVRRSLAWFKKQVAPTYAFLLRAMPDADWLMGADVMGEFKMSPAKRALLSSIESCKGVVCGVG